MRAILICPVTRTISEFDLATGLDALYTALKCSCVDAMSLDSDVVGWVDDEGLFVPLEQQGYFTLQGRAVRPLVACC